LGLGHPVRCVRAGDLRGLRGFRGS
jgi:hypothetical protein